MSLHGTEAPKAPTVTAWLEAQVTQLRTGKLELEFLLSLGGSWCSLWKHSRRLSCKCTSSAMMGKRQAVVRKRRVLSVASGRS